jgi:thiaminase/transcriptional activator TenA
MKSPRRIALTPEMISRHGLSTAPPPSGSLFWTMWGTCADIARQVLGTPFIQGIKAGTLDPVQYGGFNVNDAYYCFHGARDYGKAAERTANATLKAFLLLKQQGYETYNATFPRQWRVQSGASVIPFDACREYSAFEVTVASTEDPIYSAVVMLPCEWLWAWLAAQLQPADPGNLYAPWITGNLNPHSPYALGNFLAGYQAAHPGAIDPHKAIEIYTRAMTFERDNFAAATGAAT